MPDEGSLQRFIQFDPQLLQVDSKQQHSEEILLNKSANQQEPDLVINNDDPMMNSIFDENMNRIGHSSKFLKSIDP